MAVVLLSTSLVIGLGMGLTTLTVKGRSNPFENEGGRINPSEASQVLSDVIKTSKASEKSFRTKLSDSLKNLFIVKQASQGMPQEQSQQIKEQIEVAANELKKRHQEELAISNITSRSELQQDELIRTKLDKVLSDLNSEDSQEEPSEIAKIQTLQQSIVTPMPLEAQSQQTPVEVNTSTINQDTNRTNLRNSVKKINTGTASAAEKAKVNEIVKLNNKIQNIQTKIRVIAREIKRRNDLPISTPQSGPVQPSFQVQPQVAPVQLPIQVQVTATGAGGGGDGGGGTDELQALTAQLQAMQTQLMAEKNALQQQLTASIAQAAQAQANASTAQQAQQAASVQAQQAQANAALQAMQDSQKISVLEGQRDGAQAERNTAVAQQQATTAQLASKEALLQKAQQDLVTQQSAITQATEELAAAKALEGETRSQLVKAEQNLSDAKVELRGAQTEITQKDGSIAALQALQQEILAQRAALESRAQELQAQVESERAKSDQLKQSVAEKETMIDLKNQALSQQANLSRLEKEALERDIVVSKQEQETLSEQSEFLRQEVIAKLEEIQGMDSKIDEMNEKLAELNSTLQTEIRDKQNLTTQLAQAQANVEVQRQLKDQADTNLKQAKGDFDTAQGELQAAQQELRTKYDEARVKNAELNALKTEIAQSTGGKTQLLARIAELEAQVTQKDLELQELTGQLTQKDLEIQGLKESRKEVASPATSPRSPISPGRQTPLDKTITTLEEQGVEDVKIQSKYLVPILKIFCENLQKVLDPRLVRRYASTSKLAYSNDKSFEDATFDYRGVCVACAHTVSVVTDFIESIIKPDVKNPFHELPGPGFYDDIENTGGGVLTWKTSNYIRGILFSTKLTKTKYFHQKLWTSGQKDRATSKLPGTSAERTPLQHWTNRQIPYLADSPDTNPKGANSLYADSAARLRKHQAGIFGRLSAKGRSPGYLIGMDERISSSQMELGIKEKTTANQVGPSLLPPPMKQVTVSDAIHALTNEMIAFAGGTSVKYENVLEFLRKSPLVQNMDQNKILEKMKQLSVTSELPYLMRVFDTKSFDETPLDGVLEKQELTRLLDHLYGRSVIEGTGTHTFLRYTTYQKHARDQINFIEYKRYVNFDSPSEKAMERAEQDSLESRVDEMTDAFGLASASDGGPSAPQLQRQLSERERSEQMSNAQANKALSI
jgi:hypothetical protein